MRRSSALLSSQYRHYRPDVHRYTSFSLRPVIRFRIPKRREGQRNRRGMTPRSVKWEVLGVRGGKTVTTSRDLPVQVRRKTVYKLRVNPGNSMSF